MLVVMSNAIKFKEWRESAGLRQGQAGALIGISQPYISNIEKGKKPPSARLAMRIEQITKGAVTALDLIPDLWPPQ